MGKPSHFNILVVDDNKSILDDYNEVLSPYTDDNQSIEELFQDISSSSNDQKSLSQDSFPIYHITAAYSGEDAIERVEEAISPFSIVFLDVRMPGGIDGIETLEKLWILDPNIEAVLVTAYNDYTWEEIHRRLSPTDNLLFLKKPFDIAELRQLAFTLSKKWALKKSNQHHTNKLTKTLHKLRHEVSNREEAEKKLKNKTKELLKVNSAKSKLITLISDSLGAPLQDICKHNEQLADKLNLKSQQKHAIEIHKAVQLIQTILDSVVELKQLQTGNITVAQEKISIHTMLNELLDILYATELKELMSIQNDVSKSLQVYADPLMLHTILRNIIFYATQYIERGSVIHITSSHNESHGKICIIYNSKGKRPFTNNTLFHDSTTADIVLMLSKELVEKNNGIIFYPHVVDTHTEIAFTLPLSPSDETTGGSLPILVVDDELDNQYIIHRILKKLGYLPDIVSNGFEALEALKHKKYSVVLMDMHMPKMNGVETVLEMHRQIESLVSIPKVIAFTSHDSSDLREQCFNAGIDDFAEKTISPKKLDKLIRKWGQVTTL